MIEELYVVMGLATILFVWLRNRFTERPKDPLLMDLDPTTPMELDPLTPMEICEVDEKYVDKRILKTAPLESPNWDSLIESKPKLSSICETKQPFTIKKSSSWSSLVEDLEERSVCSDLEDMSSD